MERPVEYQVLKDGLHSLAPEKVLPVGSSKVLESSRKWRETFDSVSEAVWLNDANGRIIQCNRAAELLLNRHSDEITGHRCNELVHGTEDFIRRCPFALMKKTLRRESAFIQVDNRCYNVVVDPVFSGPRAITGAIHIMYDITDLRRTEEALHESKEKYLRFFLTSKDGIFITDKNWDFLDVNAAEASILGFAAENEVTGNNFLDFVLKPPEKNAMVRKIEQEGFIKDFELQLKRKNDLIIPCQVTAVRIEQGGLCLGYQGTMRDLTLQKSVESQLIQSRKMEAIGTFSGGIAHDFNNMLAAIMGNTAIARKIAPQGHKLLEFIINIEDAAKRASGLVRQLMHFARPDKSEDEERVISLNAIVEETLTFLRAIITSTISIEKSLSVDPCIIKAAPSTISLVVTNLSINARDSMISGGTLHFTTEKVTIDEEYCRGCIGSSPGEFFLLRVKDTGAGMMPEVMDHIFEPFFTTKASGTGLGLAMVYSSMNALGGWIEVKSEPGQGTEFNLFFPVTREEPLETEATVATVKGGTETILFIDDEKMIVKMGKRVLEMKGYTVMTARDGADALSEFFRYRKDIDMIIVDLDMPVIGGLRVIDEVCTVSPHISVIVITGSSEKSIPCKFKDKVKALLLKPFTPGQLCQTVRRVFDSVDSESANK